MLNINNIYIYYNVYLLGVTMKIIFFNNVSNGDSIKVYSRNAIMNPNTVSPIASHSYKK